MDLKGINMSEQTRKVRFVINDHMTSYLRFFAKLGFPFSKKALQITEGKSEIVFPMSPWFTDDWKINENYYTKFEALGLQKNLGSFHSIMEFHPTHPVYYADYDNEAELERNTALLKVQIELASRLGASYEGPKFLVCHPAGSYDSDPNVFIDRLVKVFGTVLEYADEKNVIITFEPDIGRGEVYYHGSGRYFNNVAKIVEKLTAIAPKKNLQTPASITFDFSHTMLENDRSFDKMQAIIREYGNLITYAHINHPLKYFFHKVGVPVLSKKLHQSHAVAQLWHIFMYTQDGHNPIYNTPNHEKVVETLRMLKEKTRIPEFGRINLEVGTRWDRGFNFFRSGASGYGTYKSLQLLDSIFNS